MPAAMCLPAAMGKAPATHPARRQSSHAPTPAPRYRGTAASVVFRGHQPNPPMARQTKQPGPLVKAWATRLEGPARMRLRGGHPTTTTSRWRHLRIEPRHLPCPKKSGWKSLGSVLGYGPARMAGVILNHQRPDRWHSCVFRSSPRTALSGKLQNTRPLPPAPTERPAQVKPG